MPKITAAEFKTAVNLNPAWASTLTEPVEVTDFCDMHGSRITHLSKHLHFTGQDEYGHSANFCDCMALKVAEGTFHGTADFMCAGIEKIGELVAIGYPKPHLRHAQAADFTGCKELKVAEGTYHGSVNFSYCGIEKVGKKLKIQPAAGENSAPVNFNNCKKLRIAEGHFPGHADFSHSGINQIGDLNIDPSPTGEIDLGVFQCRWLTLQGAWFDRHLADPKQVFLDNDGEARAHKKRDRDNSKKPGKARPGMEI